MSGRLILVRHGQSQANVERRLDTRLPGADLTDAGRRQAGEFARSRAAAPAVLLHSLARRAAQTAAVIADEFALTPIEVGGVHEVQVGDLEDRHDDEAIAEFSAVYRRWCDGDLAASMPGGESGDEVLARYLPVLAELRRRHLDDQDGTGDVVLVSHGAAIRLAAAALVGVAGELVVANPLANAEAVVLAPDPDGGWSCLGWGRASAPT